MSVSFKSRKTKEMSVPRPNLESPDAASSSRQATAIHGLQAASRMMHQMAPNPASSIIIPFALLLHNSMARRPTGVTMLPPHR